MKSAEPFYRTVSFSALRNLATNLFALKATKALSLIILLVLLWSGLTPVARAGTINGLSRQVSELIRTVLMNNGDSRLALRMTCTERNGTGFICRTAEFILNRLLKISYGQPVVKWTDRIIDTRKARLKAVALVLDLLLTKENDKLILRGTLYRMQGNFWQNIIAPQRPKVLRKIVFKEGLDRECQCLMGVNTKPGITPPGPWRLRPILRLAQPVLAVAAGDITGNGRGEAIFLTRREVLAYKIEKGHPVRLHTYSLVDLKRARAISRDPRGAILVKAGKIWARTTDQEIGVVLGRQAGTGAGKSSLIRHQSIAYFPLAAVSAGVIKGQIVPGQNSFRKTIFLPGHGKVVLDSRIIDLTVTVGGLPLILDKQHRLRGLKTDLRTVVFSLPNIGSAYTGARCTEARQQELVVSAVSESGKGDNLRVFTFGSGRLNMVWERKIPESVLAMAAGDLNGDGREEVLVAVLGKGGTLVYLLER